MASDQGESDNDEGTVLSPEELDFTQDDSVEEIDEGRFVISPDESTPVPLDTSDESTDDESEDAAQDRSDELTADQVHEWLRTDLERTSSKYGFDISAKFEEGVDQETLYSNDIVTTFENLLVWYAQRAGGDTPVEEVLGILLLEASVPISFPPRTIKEFVAQYELSRSDTIGDLLAGIEDEDVQFPP